ncbi:ABC transporter substrate-binding protein [Agrobacterium sp. CCNWLW32]|jgi:peptide/nickel transport system substrate-binding protein|uniref:ABC transporter substrate-binding protein n=1 Tax=Agrobacterium TaxID=357 RepID=UPI000DD0DDCC|nr:ABC transporter substrate-binding protein [Agrobacterium tumefaciens]NTE65909.1 ABC transporter substrate-binding protein [Agrobacterium tumefaciens]
MKHFLATAALGALLIGAMPLSTFAETPKDQLIVATTMSNILTLDPAAITGRETVQVLNNVYDTLVVLSPRDRSVQPRLAERWEIAEDRKSIRFHLRRDAKFASGNAVTAKDVAWSLKRLLARNLAQSSFLKTRGFKLEEADKLFVAENDQTFVLNIPKPDDPNLLLMILAQNGPGSIIDSQTALANEKDGDLGGAWLTLNSAGSGPFKLTQWKSNEYIILTRNDDYWGEKAKMKRILMRHLPESQSQRLMLEKGDIDVAYSLQAPDLKSLEADKAVTIESTPGSGFYYLSVSMKDEKFANKKVREALRYLIDYDGLDKAVMPYYGKLHQRSLSTGVMGALPDQGYKLDVEKAKALLAEAGYPNGFKTTLRVLSEDPFMKAATAIQNTLAQAGIQAELISGSGDQIYGAMRERNFELLLGRGGGGQQPHPDNNLRSIAYNPNNADDAKLTNYQSWRTSFFDEKLNKMIEEALVERDVAKQTKLYEDLQGYMDETVMSIQPFSEVIDTAAFRSDIKGMIVSPWLSRFEEVSKER